MGIDIAFLRDYNLLNQLSKHILPSICIISVNLILSKSLYWEYGGSNRANKFVGWKTKQEEKK